MKKENHSHFIDPFLQILPSLDLHGETSDTIKALIDDFISYNNKIGKKKIAIIHGRHGQILKKTTHEIISKNKIVDIYYIYQQNDGITIVECK